MSAALVKELRERTGLGLLECKKDLAAAGGDVRALSLIHATRVLVIVTLAPVIMQVFWQVDLTVPPGQGAAETDPVEIAVMVIAGFAGWRIAERIGLFGARPRSCASFARQRTPLPHISARLPSALKSTIRAEPSARSAANIRPSAPIPRRRSHNFTARAARSAVGIARSTSASPSS